jgi:hypothetical protein
MRVVSRVIQSNQLDLPLKALLDAPTVADMARVSGKRGEASERSDLGTNPECNRGNVGARSSIIAT